jgi:hypothetical protein
LIDSTICSIKPSDYYLYSSLSLLLQLVVHAFLTACFAIIQINAVYVHLAMASIVPEVVSNALQTVKVAMKRHAIYVKIAMA